MVNSAKIAMELHGKLPAEEAPELTDGYEGFYHLLSIHGDVEKTELHYIIRDFDREAFDTKKAHLEKIVAELRKIYGSESILIDMKDQYYNMKEKIHSSKTHCGDCR